MTNVDSQGIQTPREASSEPTDALARDFGPNAWLAMDLLDQYRQDPQALPPSWRTYFQGRGGRAGAPPDGAVPAPGPAAPAAGAGASPPPPDGVPSLLAGPALRVAQNMEASLGIPTAASVRVIPARILEENRRLINEHRDSAGQGRISFTHLVAWALLRALEAFPRLNDAYGVVDGKPQRLRKDSVALGIAVDLTRKDGSRMLLVPNVKDAHRLEFPAFLEAFDQAVGRARRGASSPDDFLGTTVTLTNAGVAGTTVSAPRLMPGQGLIVATGALEVPAAFRSMPLRARAALGISKVMAVTSTYDHRIIQGAESGQMLARLDGLLQGEDRFYETVFGALGVAVAPLAWAEDQTPALGGPDTGREEMEKQARLLQLIRAYRVRGHLVADLDPLDSPRPAPRELEPSALRPDHLGPGPGVLHQRPGRPGPGHLAGDPGGAAGHLLPHGGRRVHVHPGIPAPGVDPGAHGGLPQPGAPWGPETAGGSWASWCGRRPSNASCTPSTSATSVSPWKAAKP